MVGDINSISKIFYSANASLLTETKVAGYLLGVALIAYGLYLRKNSSERIVMRDGSRTFSHISTRTHLVMEYKGDTPERANDAFKREMTSAIRFFLTNNNIRISEPLPEISYYELPYPSWGNASIIRGSWSCNISRLTDAISHVHNLVIEVHGEPDNSELRQFFARSDLQEWRKAFNITDERLETV